VNSNQSDVVCIGNAIVDVLTQVDESEFSKSGMTKGSMTLIDSERADELYAAMHDGLEACGGSAANTAVGIASLGGQAHYIGKVSEDGLGDVFAKDIRDQKVAFRTERSKGELSTARCLIYVTPDSQRTMNTYLGACTTLSPDDVTSGDISAAKVTYMEGYLWDAPAAKEAFIKAIDICHAAGRKASLTLSDSFCVERFRSEFNELVTNQIDILFANEAEICSLYQTNSLEDAIACVRENCELTAITCSEKGSIIISGDETIKIKAAPVEKVVDTTGAGDLYAAGFLYGYTQGYDLELCGKIASLAAAEIISHFGARPAVSLAELAKPLLKN
jgi:sugar/nucleoside kinase (ribokinase family)